ncbi:MAG: hypothetical protein GY804_14285 [Alphaproteobacteria bacterium]|nr:hypothetical protein [Alphaproteobacteria bacterium]
MRQFLIVFSICLISFISNFLFINNADANPFLRKKEPAAISQSADINNTNLSTSYSVEKPSVISTAWFKIMRYQKILNSKITKHMKRIKKGDLIALFGALGIAFVYGIVHAIGPGHGKIIISSYYLGNEAQKRQAPLMALTFAFTHVISAIVIIWGADKVSSFMLGKPSAEVTGVKMFSYGTIIFLGCYMLYSAIMHKHQSHHNHVNDNENDAMELEDDLEDVCRSIGACCSHMNLKNIGEKPTFLAFATGLVPCAGAILVMLYALANDVVLTGVMVVVAIALGMATTLTALGFVMIYSRQKVISMFSGHSSLYYMAGRTLKAIGAICIILGGTAMLMSTLS